MLRDVYDDDLEVFFEYQRDPEASAMAAFPARGGAEHDAHWSKVRSDQEIIARTVVFGGDVVGNVVSFPAAGAREVAYWIGREHWGRGFATAALAELLAEDAERPMFARVAVHNVGSARVLEKCGFGKVDEFAAADGINEALFRLD